MTAVVVVVVLATSAVLFDVTTSATAKMLTTLLAVAGWSTLVWSPLRSRLTTRCVLAGSAVLLVLAVATPPRQSGDLWTYAMYGRTVAAHHSSPYAQPPAAFPSDPALARVAPRWRRTPAPYGPAFVGIAASIVAFTGTDALSTRLAFQSLAALAVGVAVLLLARRRVAPAQLALLALNPVVFLEVINGGHNDALVGLLLLIATLLVLADRFTLAAAVAGTAVLVKFVVGLALVALLLWLWRRRGTATTVRATVAAVAVVVVGYLLAGGTTVLEPLESASEQITRTSVWQYLRPGQLAYLLALGPPATPDSRVAVTSIAPFLVVAVAALVAVAMSRRPTPVPAVAGAVVVYLLLAAYVLPWYVAWVLPVLALERDGLLGPIVGVQSSLLLVAWQYRGVAPDITDPRVVLWWASALVVSVTAVAATGVLVWKSVGHLVTAQTRSSATPLRR